MGHLTITCAILTLIARSITKLPLPVCAQQPPTHSRGGGPATAAALEAPLVKQLQFVEGPGIDLVALNRRRFEFGHKHGGGGGAGSQPTRFSADFIDSQLGQFPDRLFGQLPDELAKQVVDSFQVDKSLLIGEGLVPSEGGGDDDVSLERLTKSCLTVRASSATESELNVTFHLFTRQNLHTPFVMGPQVSRRELLSARSPFKSRKPVKWITHGFHTNLDKSEWMLETKEKILAFEDANVFLTDWRRGASPKLANYPKAAANAHTVAKMIVNILRKLRADIGELGNVHLIGHSLGAHIMGFVGSAFTEEYLQARQQALSAFGHTERLPANHAHLALVGRVTACDPALPCFGPASSAPNHGGAHSSHAGQSNQAALADWTPTMWTHLRPDSAQLVEVVHSNPGVMGYVEPLGDYDFYPNGLSNKQPGCGETTGATKQPVERTTKRYKTSVTNYLVNNVLKPIGNLFTGYTCSHHRSVELMVESMYYERVPFGKRLDKSSVCQMVGYKCNDYLSFKRGFCFSCRLGSGECRAFGQQQAVGVSQPAWPAATAQSSSARRGERLSSEADERRARRALPSLNQYEMLQRYRAARRNLYFFDTRAAKPFCLHHYHLLIKYRWLNSRANSIQLSSFTINGQFASLTRLTESEAHKFAQNTYTMLITYPFHLGPIESLSLVKGSELIAANQIEFVDVTYMSNLDENVRALSSARLCRSDSGASPPAAVEGEPQLARHFNYDGQLQQVAPLLFVRCKRGLKLV